MRRLVVLTSLMAAAYIAQGQDQRMATSIPSTSLNEPAIKTRNGKVPRIQPSFGLSISATQTTFAVGSPENITIRIDNITDKEIPWSPGYNDVRITARRGSEEAERTALHRNLRGEPKATDPPLLTSGSSVTLLVPPHQRVSQTLDIRKLYDLPPGEYKVVAQRYDAISDVFVRSNEVLIMLTP